MEGFLETDTAWYGAVLDPQEVNQRNRRGWRDGAARYAGAAQAVDDVVMRTRVRGMFIEGLRGPRVLEVGCGPGTDSKTFHDTGLDLLATDYSPEFLQILGERFPDIETRQMDMTHPDLPPSSFDGIYGFASFVHLPRALALPTLEGFHSLLKPDGLLFLLLVESDLTREYFLPRPGGAEADGQEPGDILVTCYQRSELEALLIQAGFPEPESHPIPSIVYDKVERLRRLGVRTFAATARRPGSSSA